MAAPFNRWPLLWLVVVTVGMAANRCHLRPLNIKAIGQVVRELQVVLVHAFAHLGVLDMLEALRQ